MRRREGRGAPIGTAVVVAALLALLGGTIWYAIEAWTSVEGPPMPASGWVAMVLGTILTLVVGVGLMALLFYSRRHGYDEPSRLEEKRDEGE